MRSKISHISHMILSLVPNEFTWRQMAQETIKYTFSNAIFTLATLYFLLKSLIFHIFTVFLNKKNDLCVPIITKDFSIAWFLKVVFMWLCMANCLLCRCVLTLFDQCWRLCHMHRLWKDKWGANFNFFYVCLTIL